MRADIISEIRPDWDLATPGLRQRRQAGDHSQFYPYKGATAC